jgi:hypothetical protein
LQRPIAGGLFEVTKNRQVCLTLRSCAADLKWWKKESEPGPHPGVLKQVVSPCKGPQWLEWRLTLPSSFSYGFAATWREGRREYNPIIGKESYMHTIRSIALVVALGLFTMTSAGCLAVAAAGAAGAGVAYMMGDLKGTVDASPTQAVQAAEGALQDMGITVLTSNADDLEGTITARTARDRRVRIDVKRETASTSNVSIRIGTFGDEALSREIYDRLRQRL